MPHTRYQQSVNRLADEDRARLLAAFEAQAPLGGFDYFVTRLIYETGMHPSVLCEVELRLLRIVTTPQGVQLLQWRRPKTTQLVETSIPKPIAGWLPGFIEELKAVKRNPVFINEVVHRFGRTKADLPALTPRTLRHDFAFRKLSQRGLLDARSLSGTTTQILLRYSGEIQTREAALRDAAESEEAGE
jgi:integrase